MELLYEYAYDLFLMVISPMGIARLEKAMWIPQSTKENLSRPQQDGSQIGHTEAWIREKGGVTKFIYPGFLIAYSPLVSHRSPAETQWNPVDVCRNMYVQLVTITLTQTAAVSQDFFATSCGLYWNYLRHTKIKRLTKLQ